MRNKKFIALAAAFVLSVQAGLATDITGVSGINGVYDINPETHKGSVGFRHYDNFYLSEGDVANLIMKIGSRNLGTFINLVDNKVNIQGLLNTVRNGQFVDGHAVFISPKGMVVGQNGVLNVGSLSVLTPNSNTYDALKKDPLSTDLAKLQNETNGEILVKGKILSRGDVNLRASNVILPENATILNGVKDNVVVKTLKEANDLLFNSLVNTQDLNSATALTQKEGKIVLKSNSEDGMLNVRGNIYNLNKGEVKLINEKGANGIKVTGEVHNANGSMLLENHAGQTLIKGSLVNNGDTLYINDDGAGIHINSGASVVANSGSLKIKNNGTNGLAIYGDVKGLDKNMSIENNNGRLYIAGNVDYKGGNEFQIVNNAADKQLMIAKTGKISSDKSVYIKNKGDGGLYVNGTIHSANALTLDNKAGDLTINNKVYANNGNLSVMNTGNKLAISSKGSVEAKGGNLTLKNTGAEGLLVYGNVENDGKTISISNSAGNLTVDGTVNAKSGNVGIVNNGNLLQLTKNSVVNSATGKVNVINKGNAGLKAYGKVNAEQDITVVNEAGQAYIDGDIASNGSNISIAMQKDSKGLYVKETAKITNLPRIEAGKVGDIIIQDTAKAGGSGIIIRGEVNSNNNVIVRSTDNNIYTSGTVRGANNVLYKNVAERGKVSFTQNSTVHSGDGKVDYLLKNNSQVYWLPMYVGRGEK